MNNGKLEKNTSTIQAMHEQMLHTLEYDKILERLAGYALCAGAKERLSALRPYPTARACALKTAETSEARALYDTLGAPPLSPMTELMKILELCEKGSMLLPAQLEQVELFLASCRRMRAYLSKAGHTAQNLGSYGASLDACDTLAEEISRSIRGGMVDDGASATLRSTRRKLDEKGAQIKERCSALLRAHKEWFSDGYVAQRDGHFVLPVKREHKNKVPGAVVGASGSGGTVFIEPSSVGKLQQEAAHLAIEEENEVRRVLYALTALVDDHRPALQMDAQAMEELDFVFAKAKLSAALSAAAMPVTEEEALVIRQGRHPLLDRERCVPLDFALGRGIRGVVITGPNTGGKTVALKTVGLLCAMAQSGLHVPAGEGSVFPLRDAYLCDIGDGQSIEENLSTFSSHLVNVTRILESATRRSLVLLDELGSGTDPAEGMGIACAILEELRAKESLFFATTHYPEIKEYAEAAGGVENARMAFDRESLRPLYQLETGKAGESCALYIAERLGFPARLLELAREAAEQGGCKPRVHIPSVPDDLAPARETSAAAAEETEKAAARFTIGDSVLILPAKENAIIYRPADEHGMCVVQVKDEKRAVSHKRLQLLVPAKELYPPDYDFSIIFDSVQARKARHQMGKHHVPGMEIEIGPLM